MTSSLRRQLTLRTSLVLLIGGATLPFLFVSGVLLLRMVRDSRAGVERILLDSARQQAAALDADLDASLQTLRALTTSSALTDDAIDPFVGEAQRIVATQPAWLALRLLAPDGRVLVDSARGEDQPPGVAVDPGSLEETVRSGRPTISPVRRGPRGRLAFGLRMPVVRDGVVRYVLTAVMTPDSVHRVLNRVGGVPNEWTRVVVDEAGTVVARTRSPERFVGQPATASFMARTTAAADSFYRDTSLDGAEVYVAFSRAPMSKWVSAVVVPVEVMDGPLWTSIATLVAVGLFVLVVSTGGVYWLAGRIAGDIDQASRAAEALSRGQPAPASESFVRDVTHLRRAIEESSVLLTRRSEERDRLLAQTEAARSDAERASLAKDQFLAMLGHELRNPLSPIATALALLKLRGTNWTREHEVIERQVAHMSRLVDDLLDVSRITRGTLDIRREVVALVDVMTRATEMASPLLEEHRHSLAIDIPDGICVEGDAVRLAQVFGNLLTNAAAYTPEGGSIRVHATLRDREVEVAVSDTGRGIPPDLAPHIFDLFVQGPRTIDRREGGLGLGLAIARSLVMLHGGRIAASSEGPGLGSTFTVVLPACDPQRVAPAARGASPAYATRRRRVLVVDDNRDAAEMLATLLEAGGHDVAIAGDGPGALAQLERFDPDVAILDIGLPVMDGYELARRMREHRPPDRLMLIALTGYGQVEDIAQSRAAGFSHHLVKPMDSDALLRLLDAPAS